MLQHFRLFFLSFIERKRACIPTITANAAAETAPADYDPITCPTRTGLYGAAHGHASWHVPSQGQGDKRGSVISTDPSMPGYVFLAAVNKVGKNGPAVPVLREEARQVLWPPNMSMGSAWDSRCSQPTRWLFASNPFSPTPPATQIQLLLE